MSTALVLAGGGVGAIAWQLGVLFGLADADAQLAETVISADTVIGTSGGSCVAAQITSGKTLDELYTAQLSADSAEIDVKLDMVDFMNRFGAAVAGAVDDTDRCRRIGAFALAANTVEENKRRAELPRACRRLTGRPAICESPPLMRLAASSSSLRATAVSHYLTPSLQAARSRASGRRPASESVATSTAACGPALMRIWLPKPIASSSSLQRCATLQLRALGAICKRS